MFKREAVQAVGFDLDGTFYPEDPEINNRIRNKISEHLLQKNPQMKTLPQARSYFETHYEDLQSGRQVLQENGFDPEEAGKTMDASISEADILDLLRPDTKLANLLRRLPYQLFLITSNTQDMAEKKLEKLCIDATVFTRNVYTDTPGAGYKTEGKPFNYLLNQTNIPAEQHVYIGNSKKSDILPAKKTGMQTIAVWSSIPEADISIEHIHQLEEVFL